MHGRTRWLVAALALVAVAIDLAPQLLGNENEVSLRAEELGLGSTTTERLRGAIARGEWQAAEDILFKEANGHPQRAILLRALGIAHYQAGRYFSAASALKRSDALARLEPEARFLLASSFIRIERRHWARAELERLVARDGDAGSYRLALAQVHYDQGQFAAAVWQLDQILDRTPEWAAAHDLRGQCLEGLGDNRSAIAAFQRAVSLNLKTAVESAWPHYHLGSLLHDLGQLVAAETALARALAADPAHAPAQRELGIVYMKANKLRLAAEALASAAQLSPLDASVQYSLVSVYRRLGREGDAAAAMERFRELSE